MNEVVLVDIADRVAVLTLNRPEARNALNRDVRKALPAAIVVEPRDREVAGVRERELSRVARSS